MGLIVRERFLPILSCRILPIILTNHILLSLSRFGIHIPFNSIPGYYIYLGTSSFVMCHDWPEWIDIGFQYNNMNDMSFMSPYFRFYFILFESYILLVPKCVCVCVYKRKGNIRLANWKYFVPNFFVIKDKLSPSLPLSTYRPIQLWIFLYHMTWMRYTVCLYKLHNETIEFNDFFFLISVIYLYSRHDENILGYESHKFFSFFFRPFIHLKTVQFMELSFEEKHRFWTISLLFLSWTWSGCESKSWLL